MEQQLLDQFQFENTNIRVLGTPEEPWFVARDVCDVLELDNSRQATSYLDKEEKGVIASDTLGGNQKLSVINESGLYSLILNSRKPKAREFRKWITSEVIPSIRKHGGYMTPEKTEEILNDPDTIISLAQNLKNERNRRQAVEEEKDELEDHNRKLQPKAEYHDEVLASKKLMPVKIIAKELGTGPQLLNRFLHKHGVIYKQGGVWYLYHNYQGKGYARYGTYKKLTPDGKDVITYHHLKWTEKGRHFIHNLWKKAQNQLPGSNSTAQINTDSN